MGDKAESLIAMQHDEIVQLNSQQVYWVKRMKHGKFKTDTLMIETTFHPDRGERIGLEIVTVVHGYMMIKRISEKSAASHFKALKKGLVVYKVEVEKNGKREEHTSSCTREATKVMAKAYEKGHPLIITFL